MTPEVVSCSASSKRRKKKMLIRKNMLTKTMMKKMKVHFCMSSLKNTTIMAAKTCPIMTTGMKTPMPRTIVARGSRTKSLSIS